MPQTVDYAITVTLCSRHRKLPAESQLVLTKPLILKALKYWKVSLVAELTTNFDLHYHGIASKEILGKIGDYNLNPLKELKDAFRSDFGFTCVKQVEDYEGWCKYISKDVLETNKYVYPIIKDDYGVFKTGFHLPIDI